MFKITIIDKYINNLLNTCIDDLVNDFNQINIERDVPSICLEKVFNHRIENYSFGNLDKNTCIELYKDGRVFSHFIERWLEKIYPLKFISGCKGYDHIDINNSLILYDEKTFTKNGCNFCPSNMIGGGRKFDKLIFDEKSKKIIFCIISNINFPIIQIKFISGIKLIKLYPKGKIPFKDRNIFFN